MSKVNGQVLDGFKSDSVSNKHTSNNTIPTINTEEEFKIRRRKIIEGYNNEVINLNKGYSSKEVVIAK